MNDNARRGCTVRNSLRSVIPDRPSEMFAEQLETTSKTIPYRDGFIAFVAVACLVPCFGGGQRDLT